MLLLLPVPTSAEAGVFIRFPPTASTGARRDWLLLKPTAAIWCGCCYSALFGVWGSEGAGDIVETLKDFTSPIDAGMYAHLTPTMHDKGNFHMKDKAI